VGQYAEAPILSLEICLVYPADMGTPGRRLRRISNGAASAWWLCSNTDPGDYQNLGDSVIHPDLSHWEPQSKPSRYDFARALVIKLSELLTQVEPQMTGKYYSIQVRPELASHRFQRLAVALNLETPSLGALCYALVLGWDWLPEDLPEGLAEFHLDSLPSPQHGNLLERSRIDASPGNDVGLSTRLSARAGAGDAIPPDSRTI
jgi:hypothetical protein